MTGARRAVAYAALALLLGCGEDRATPIRAEIAKLKKERVPSEQLATATKEAADSEGARDAAVAKAAKDDAELAAAHAELDRLQAALQREADRNAELRGELDAKNAPLAAAASQTDALEKKVAERRKRLGVLRDQAKALAKALQAQDPAWAETRRMAALRDYAEDVEMQLPSEPAVQALSSALGQSPPPRPPRCRPTKSTAKPMPARMPSTTLARVVAASEESTAASMLEVSHTAGSASTNPTIAAAEGRSPSARPTSAGNPAASTPESGATTFIRPRPRPR